jgi:hypothetical protein
MILTGAFTFLLGVTLSQRFSAFVLVPASMAIAPPVAVIGVLSGHPFAEIAILAAVAIGLLNIGYFLGMMLFLPKVERRDTVLRSSWPQH